MAEAGTPADADADIEKAVAHFLATHPVTPFPDQAFRGARFDAGLAFVHFEPGHGGLGRDPAEQPGLEQAFARAGCPDWTSHNLIGLGMAAPTIHTHGTERQKNQLLRPLFTGAEIWCQLFSEPGAGSDVAALSTRAVRVEGGWLINGQKVWTTLAHVARRGLLLARTDPEQVKHRGLTYFLLDMQAGGVEVRPLRQLTGEAEFNEVYLSDVFIADDDVLGDVGGGWSVAMTTLMNERQSLGGRVIGRGEGPIGQAVRAFQASVERGRDEPADLERLMLLWVRAEAARLTNVRAGDARQRGTPGPEASIAKLLMAELNKAVYNLAMDLIGNEALLFGSYEQTRPDFAAIHGGSGDIRYDYLRSLANSIEGGTSEILRTILGERVLGLAPEPRVDKSLPWSQVPRS